MVLGEVLGLIDLVDTGLDPTQSTGADYGHAILLGFVQLLELLAAPDTGLGIPLQLGDHSVFFHGYVFLHIRAGDLEVVLFLEVHNHAAEVLADEFIEELGAGVAVGNVVLGEDLVGEVGAGFEGEFFRENEGIVTVEEDFCDLKGGIWLAESVWARKMRCKGTLGMMTVV